MINSLVDKEGGAVDDELQGGIHVVAGQHDTTLIYDDEDFYQGVNDIGWLGMHFGRQGVDGTIPSGQVILGRVAIVNAGGKTAEASVIIDELKIAATASALRAFADALDRISRDKCDSSG